MSLCSTTYDVQIIRAGQSRAYADSEYEYLISVTYREGNRDARAYVQGGDVEAHIKRDEAARAAGTMFGGMPPDALRKEQRDWAKKIVRALCRNFREKDDDDGRAGMDAAFYPTLKSLTIDHKAGTIRALIIELYTD